MAAMNDPLVRASLRSEAVLLAIGCACALLACRPSLSPPPPPGSRSADLGGWLDAASDPGRAGSTTLPRTSIPEAPPGEPVPRSFRTLASAIAEPSRPRRRAPVDVSFHESDMANAFQLLAAAGGFDLVMGDALTGRLSATLHAVDPYDALVAMAEANGVEVRYDGRVVLVKKR